MRANSLFAAALAASVSACAWATVTASVLGGQGTAIATQDPNTSKWTVVCEATSPNLQLTQFIIEGNDNDVIESIHIDNNSAVQRCEVIIRTALGFSDGIDVIEEITSASTTGQEVRILSMETDGDVGSIQVDAIIFAYIGGDLLGDVLVETNAIRELIVQDNVGSSTDPVSIVAGCHWRLARQCSLIE